MKIKQKNAKLSGKQIRYLKGLGHHLKPLVTLGREGLNDNVVLAAQAVLAAHELVKIKIGSGCLLDRGEAAELVAEKTGAEIVQVLGKTVLIFRANPDRDDDRKIKLPQ